MLTAPFPWFGGKRRAAPTVWSLFGDATGYIEPFCGSLAVLLARPDALPVETVNDADGFVANFWRAVAADAEAVARWADWPVNECDLEARHAWLVNRSQRLRWSLEDPDFYDAKVAGWWVWGACSWIGSGWCSGNGPHVGNGAHIHAGGDAGQGINRKLPHLSDAGRGLAWLTAIQERIRRVRVACGDWSRVVTNSVVRACGPRPAIFMDPPYGEGSLDYAGGGNACGAVASDVWKWAVDNGHMRIVVAAYEDERSVPDGWTVHRWRARKGYQSAGNKDRLREVLYASPACVAQRAPQLGLGDVA